MYAMLGTRPDLAYTISTLSKHNVRPMRTHHIALQRVFRYLRQTQQSRIRYGNSSCQYGVFPRVTGYTDSDSARDRDERKSTGGYVFILCGGAISQKSRKQYVVATFSAEAEQVALTEAAKEAVWLRRLPIKLASRVITVTMPNITNHHFHHHKEQWESLYTKAQSTSNDSALQLTSTGPQIVYADTQGPIKLSDNSQFHARTKHIDIHYHYIRTACEHNEVLVTYIPTAEMTTDILTNALMRDKYKKHIPGMGMVVSD